MNQTASTSPSGAVGAASSPRPTTADTYLVPLDGPRRDDLLAALHLAADTALTALDCNDCAALACRDEQHRPRLEQVRIWLALTADLEQLPATGVDDAPLIRFDADACRDWLLTGAADEAGIHDGFNTEALTIAAGLDELLSLLNNDSTQQVWQPAAHVHDVLIWRTADGDGVDGGGVLTVDLNYMGHRVRLGSLHQGFDDFTHDAATSGIDAAIEALGHVAATINREYVNLRRATACPPPSAPDDSDGNDRPGNSPAGDR